MEKVIVKPRIAVFEEETKKWGNGDQLGTMYMAGRNTDNARFTVASFGKKNQTSIPSRFVPWSVD